MDSDWYYHRCRAGTGLTFVQGSDVALDGTGGAQHAQLAPGITLPTS